MKNAFNAVAVAVFALFVSGACWAEAGAVLNAKRGESIQLNVEGCSAAEYPAIEQSKITGEAVATCRPKTCVAAPAKAGWRWVWSQNFKFLVYPGERDLGKNFKGTAIQAKKRLRELMKRGDVCARALIFHVADPDGEELKP